MNKHTNKRSLVFSLLKWAVLAIIIGILIGSLAAFFLASLDWVTKVRKANGWIIIFLPLCGMLFAFFYQRFGGNSSRGNNLIIEQGNGQDEKILLRMIPLTLFGTLSTHLFGGSVGREGTAVQMGGAIAEQVGKKFNLTKTERQIVIISGISGGFSGVFGTPLAGAIFSIEVLALGKMRVEAFYPALLTALVSNSVATGLGATHTHYEIGKIPDESILLFLKLTVIGILFGLVARLFSRMIEKIKGVYLTYMPNGVIRNGVGGVIVLGLVLLFSTTRYLGLSLELLTDAFKGQGKSCDFILKLIFTVFSLGAGYQGGEVTPLFEIGATLGSTLAPLISLPIAFVAALGMIGVFAGATNTPIACCVMGLELFGGEGALFMLFVCLISYQFSGEKGIYASQDRRKGKGIKRIVMKYQMKK